MKINYLALLVAAASAIVIGFVWYHEKVFGTAWMKTTGLDKEKLKGANMAKIIILSLVYAFLIAFVLQTITIHQFAAAGLVGENAQEALPSYDAFMSDYGEAFRTFKHGAFHGLFTGLFIVFPVIATNAMFERKSFKYTLINSGYWILSLIVMGAIICGWKLI